MAPTVDERVKAKIVVLYKKGMLQSKIAQQLNIAQSSVSRWINRYETQNNLESRQRGRKINTSVDANIIAIIKKNSFCNLREIAANSSVHVSNATVKRRLNANGFTYNGKQWCQQKNYQENVLVHANSLDDADSSDESIIEEESAQPAFVTAGISTDRHIDSFDEIVNKMEALKRENLVLKAEKDENNKVINDFKVSHSEVRGKLTELQTRYDNLKLKYDELCLKIIIYEGSGENAAELPMEAEVDNNNSEGERNDNSESIGGHVGIKQEPIEDSLMANNDFQLNDDNKPEPEEECCSLLDAEFNHQPGIFKSEDDEELYMFRSSENYDMPTHITSPVTIKREDDVFEQVTTTASSNFHHRPRICKLETDEELYLKKTRSTAASSGSSNDTNIVIYVNDGEEGCGAGGVTMPTAAVTRHKPGIVKEEKDNGMLNLHRAKSRLNHDLRSVKIEVDDDDFIEPNPKRSKFNSTSAMLKIEME